MLLKTLHVTSLTVTSVLFMACGGSDTKTADPFTITAHPATDIKLVSGMKKDILLTSNQSNVTYEITDKTEAPMTELDRSKGILTLRADSASDKTYHVTVKAVNADTQKTSTLTVAFNIVSNAVSNTKPVLKTGADDGQMGLERNFDLNDAQDVVDPLGNIWALKSDSNLADEKVYLGAYSKCEVLRLMHTGSNWRVPTKDELLNLIDYSKNPGMSMIDEAFGEDTLTYSWAQPENGANIVVSQLNGLVTAVDTYTVQKYPVRCINPVMSETSHIISTDRTGTGYTYDYSTGLTWSPITQKRKLIDDTNETAFQYCASLGSEWRMPNINELRSVIEGGTVSTFIRDSETVLISSTRYNDANTSSKEAYYALIIENAQTSFGITYADALYGITCVKNNR